LAKYNQNDQVEEDEMGRIYGTDGKKSNIYVVGGKAIRKETTRKTKT
jgi:hypothetical protein